MKPERLNVAVMAGGDSSEHGISMQSASQVIQAMDHDRYRLFKIEVKARRWICREGPFDGVEVDKNDFSISLNGERIHFDYALILIHGTPGENGLLQAYFEMAGIPFSSSGFLPSAVAFDKSLCKKALVGTGVSLAKERIVRKEDPFDAAEIARELGLPLFVKPNASGSSFGVTKVKAVEEIENAVRTAFGEGDTVILEEFIQGDEVDCGIFSVNGKTTVLPLTEIVTEREFFDYEAKYTPGMSDEITPARISETAAERVRACSEAIYRTLGCRGVIRIDFIVKNEVPYLIEVNTVPGMSGGSIVPKQLREYGMSVGEFYDQIIQDTL